MRRDVRVVGGRLRRALHQARWIDRASQPAPAAIGVSGPYAIIDALDLPETPMRFRRHVREAIALSYDFLGECDGLGGCYRAAYESIVTMDQASRLNAHLHGEPEGSDVGLHEEDCQALTVAVLSMGDRSLAGLVTRLDAHGYLYPHHVGGVLIEGQPWAAYDPLGWIDPDALAVLETIRIED